MTPQGGPLSSVNSWSGEYIDTMYRKWRNDPKSVSEDWDVFFHGFDLGQAHIPSLESADEHEAGEAESRIESLQSRVDSLIYHYRDVGHLVAQIDPLGRNPEIHPLLELAAFELGEEHLNTMFHAQRIPYGPPRMTLQEIIDSMRTAYCGTIGVEYMFIQNTPERRWLQDRIERNLNKPAYNKTRKLRIARLLRQAVSFENFLHTNYVGQKRFSLEGGETLIPLLDSIIEKSSRHGIEEIVMGMAHRGRLNVLANVLGKSHEEIFSEFEDNYQPETIMGDGDVKYHKGYSSDWIARNGRRLHLTLTANPSHLEAVDPVVVGRVRAKQRVRNDKDRIRVLGVLMHGDAAFAGQGIVAETLNLSQLQGYRTGGTIHVIVNNQIGFTTLPKDGRSGPYCTDIAKMLQSPIFHVNGDDPEAVCHVAEMAVEYRQKFHKDAVIDMYCYRRLGHNEGDEPTFTQPTLYELIKNHPTPYDIYARKLIDAGYAAEKKLEEVEEDFREDLTDARKNAQELIVQSGNKPFQDKWIEYSFSYSHEPVETGTEAKILERIAESWVTFPKDFTPNNKVARILKKRHDAIKKREEVDWATAESLAMGTLLAEGTPVRLSGQDSRRGTFSQRHAVVWDLNTGDKYIPLNNLGHGQARFCVYDSPLSEAAVLGFDYGYSLDNPDMLICWEAQFGDFANGAQVIIDQFIVSGESKWNRASGITLLLPHGYEGQGPEHSSGWLERFLQLAAEDNIQVCNLTTPAQFFHVLRRQMKRRFRKPLVIMSPKSLLRHAKVRSSIEELEQGYFKEVLDDETIERPKDVRRVVFCSGKVYYDLAEKRGQDRRADVALVRVEQFFPFPRNQMAEVIKRYPKGVDLVWCQEEPRNRGGWTFMGPAIEEQCGVRVRYVGRPRAASPAVGSLRRFKEQQEELLATALEPSPVSIEEHAAADK